MTRPSLGCYTITTKLNSGGCLFREKEKVKKEREKVKKREKKERERKKEGITFTEIQISWSFFLAQTLKTPNSGRRKRQIQRLFSY